MKKCCWSIVALLLIAMTLFSCAGEVLDTPKNDVVLIDLIKDGASEYSVVRGDSAPEFEVEAAVTLRRAMDEAGNFEMNITTDWVKRSEPIPEGTKEILVGETNRPETADAKAKLTEDQYIIKVYPGRVVVRGHRGRYR